MAADRNTQGASVVELVEMTEHFLMEREVVAEKSRDVNERLKRGETVMLSAAPVAPAERGEELLRMWVEAARQFKKIEEAMQRART